MLFGSAAFLAACGGGGGGSVAPAGPAATSTPVATPTATATPTPTPTPLAAQNYLPVANKMGYETGTPSGYADTNDAVLGAKIADTSCTGAVGGSFGEYVLGSNAPALIPAAFANAYIAAHSGANPLYVYSKNAAGDVYIVGTAIYGQNSIPSVQCVTPYVWMKAVVSAGDSWSYTDAMGTPGTATVTEIQNSQQIAVQSGATGPNNGKTTAYNYVATIAYSQSSSLFTMRWVPGVGPVQTTDSTASSVPGVGATWTAYVVTISPGSP